VRRPAAPGRLALVQGFLNTANLEDGTDTFDSVSGLLDWLQKRDLLGSSETASEIEFRQATYVREALRTLLSAHNPGIDSGEQEHRSAAAILTEAAARSQLKLSFRSVDAADLHAHAPGVPGAIGRLLAIVHQAQIDGSWSRLKVCREDICRWAFYDYSRNRTGTWCVMAVCGSRAKMRSYYQRRTTATRELDQQ
jgi:predicted RNA-binding Zn ribbon-like protein